MSILFFFCFILFVFLSLGIQPICNSVKLSVTEVCISALPPPLHFSPEHLFSFHKTVLVFVLLLECLVIHDNIRVGELAEFFGCVHWEGSFRTVRTEK